MTRPLHITMATRAIVACGYDFSPHGGSFADADVAHDEIVGLPPPAEPLVLRVMATGGDAADQARVEGDWLCDGDLLGSRRIHPAVWLYDRDAAEWARARPWLEAWETCVHPEWMLHAAASVGVDRRVVVRAACACACAVLDLIPTIHERPRRAVEVVETWIRGEVDEDQVRQAAAAADCYAAATSYLNPRIGPLVHAAYAASSAAYAAYHASKGCLDDYAFHAACAASESAHAQALKVGGDEDFVKSWRRSRQDVARRIRGVIATRDVLRCCVSPGDSSGEGAHAASHEGSGTRRNVVE